MTETKTTKYFHAVGRRKTATARVRIFSGSGKHQVNGKDISLSDISAAPLKLVGKFSDIDSTILVNGGGKQAQLEAIRMGISRALTLLNPEFRPTLKKAGYLTRDQREVERKKPGLKKARRAPQWSKR